MSSLKLLAILASSFLAAFLLRFNSIFSKSVHTQVQFSSKGDKVSQAIQEVAKITAEKVSTLRSKSYGLAPGSTYRRILIASELEGGSAYLAGYLSRHPGVHLISDPLSTTTLPKVINVPSEPAAYVASEILVDLLNCDHRSWMVQAKNWPTKYWWPDNLIQACEDWRHNASICLNATFINGACAVAPIKILSLDVDQFLVFNLGRVLYDPWLSETTKIIYVVKDPRAIMYDRLSNPGCVEHCQRPFTLCHRLLINQIRALQFMEFTPSRFKIVRYEDLLLGKKQAFDDLLAFVGLENQHYMEQYVASQKPMRANDAYEAFPWMKSMPFASIAGVQSQCSKVMRIYGYNVIKDRSQMSATQPLSETMPDSIDVLNAGGIL